MSNLSLSYDPTQTAPDKYPVVVDNPYEAVSYTQAGAIPMNLFTLMENDTFRDVYIGTLIDNGQSTNSQVVENFAQMLRSNPDNESPTVRSLCEIIAGLSFAWGDKETAKKALIRLNPDKASTYLKTVYTAMVERNMEPEAFRSMVSVTLPAAVQNWDNSRQV